MTEPRSRTVRSRLPVDLGLTLGPTCRGRLDPAMRILPGGGEAWRATRTPEGPVTTRIRVVAPEGALTMTAWGPGAAWALDAFPALVGADDGEDGFEPGRGVVGELRRRLPGLRIGRSQAVLEALVPSMLEQKVIGLEARRSWAALVRALGEPAPGPGRLLVPPPAEVLARTPSWTFHRAGVERKRADTIRLAASCARRVEETVGMSPAEARRRLTALPGVGAWTAAEVALVALGDADAVSVGDYHLHNQVGWALAGEARATDERMLELLEPFRGHRGRVTMLIEAGPMRAPRYGPRMTPGNIAAL